MYKTLQRFPKHSQLVYVTSSCSVWVSRLALPMLAFSAVAVALDVPLSCAEELWKLAMGYGSTLGLFKRYNYH